MGNYGEMSIGTDRDVAFGGGTAKVMRKGESSFTVQRHFDGSWNTVAWVDGDNTGWRVSRQEGSVGTFIGDLDPAIEEALIRSGDALR